MDVLARFNHTKKFVRTIATKNEGSRRGIAPIGDGYYAKHTYYKTEVVKELRFHVHGARADFDAGMLERIVDKCDSLVRKVKNEPEKPLTLNSPKDIKLLTHGNYAKFDY